ncbi:hypothetical protein HPB52_015271 [Rhipicephalus sanguineus]|uniref:HTH psq-type domain-containing protein n=1 Tax=Rhipicephalus sanguineus TaxID=34632 RepID=A0A9D4SR36_RHISA|nr:hypothetical protein HPB52_015271 [Rhipicephalus sanguineus]
MRVRPAPKGIAVDHSVAAQSVQSRLWQLAGLIGLLDLATKVKILKEVEQGGTAKQDIARKYGIKPNTLSNILKNKRSVLDALENDHGEEDTSELDVDGLLPALGDVPFEEYVVTDSSVESCGALSDAEIVEMVQPARLVTKLRLTTPPPQVSHYRGLLM